LPNFELEELIKELKRENYILKQYYKAAEETNIVSKGDLQGNITYANDKFVEVSQYSKEEAMGKPHSLLKGEDSKEKFDNLWETIKSKKSWKGLLRNRKKDDSFYFVDNVITPILNED
jgi:PAS domain S-box-containing protein